MTRAILLVEDDENDVLFMTMALKGVGLTCPIRVAIDGREAQDYLSGAGKFADRHEYPLPYLVLLDLKLPRMPGLEVLKWLRERPEFDTTIVLVLTSSPMPEDIEGAYRLRANAYLVKPSGLENLRLMAQAIKDFWFIQNHPAAVST
ncbi:MAG: two-component system response regulator [Acidobacteria bacterium]|nr:MAG: two-component system response regulator [Acidobacteriota bacterium]